MISFNTSPKHLAKTLNIMLKDLERLTAQEADSLIAGAAKADSTIQDPDMLALEALAFGALPNGHPNKVGREHYSDTIVQIGIALVAAEIIRRRLLAAEATK